jgi:hypothetical protein
LPSVDASTSLPLAAALCARVTTEGARTSLEETEQEGEGALDRGRNNAVVGLATVAREGDAIAIAFEGRWV